MRKSILFIIHVLLCIKMFSQADDEIQVYASPITQKNITFVELHSNYTFHGSKKLTDPAAAHFLNETVEVTHGFGGNFEMGVYFFTAVSPDHHYQYQGSHIRPRYTAPAKWKLPVGLSLSAEFGFYRPEKNADYIWEGEIRPIIDKTINEWYFSFNPNLDFAITGDDKHLGITPQFKTVYTIKQKVGVGVEYYGDIGTFKKILPGTEQEHLIGPMIDLYFSPVWEFNSGYLFGLTPESNHGIFKILIGHRFGK